MTSYTATACGCVIVVLLSACQENPVRTTAGSAPPVPASSTGDDRQLSESPKTSRAVEPAPASDAGETAAAQVPKPPAAAPTGQATREKPAESVAKKPPQRVQKRESNHKPKFSRKSALYDRKGPAYSLLQSANRAMKRFPADRTGNIDWVRALERGMISPRATLSGRGKMSIRDDTIIMRNTRDMPWVEFPHRQHTEWLACSNCHPRPFKEKAGSNEVTMDRIMRGQQCGMCHDRVAFSTFACERCHSILHPGSPTAWW